MTEELIKGEINNISSFIHESALDPHLNLNSLSQICDACNHFDLAGLCTNLIRIPYARKYLGTNKDTKLIEGIARINFYLGNRKESISFFKKLYALLPDKLEGRLPFISSLNSG